MHIGEFYWLRTGELLKTKYHTINTCLNAKKNPIYITLRKKKMKYCNAKYLFECQDIWYISTNVNCSRLHCDNVVMHPSPPTYTNIPLLKS